MPDAVFLEETPRLNRLVHDIVASLGGSISAEHGIGALKVGKLSHYKSDVAIRMMQALKKALDPRNVMNPGRVVPLD